MSLPWRFSTVTDYVDRTMENIRGNSEKFTHLNIGKYYLHGSELETSHMIALFEEAAKNSNIQEVTLSGVFVEREALEAMIDMLTKHKRKRISINKCTGFCVEAVAPTAPVECIRIVNSEVTMGGFASLGWHVYYNSGLTQLLLFELEFMGEQMEYLARGIGASKSLKLLELSYCTLDNGAIAELSSALSRNCSLDSFFIPGCEVGDEQLTSLMTSLNRHPRLSHLKVFRNHCGSVCASRIADLLEGSSSTSCDNSSQPTIQSLDLSYQQFERAGKVEIQRIFQNMSQNSTLKSLKLSFNKLNDRDAEIIAAGLRDNRVLEELDLRANNIRDEGIVALAENAVSRASLVKLFLFGNPISNRGAEALLAAIRENVKMEVLNLDYCTSFYNTIQFYTCLNRAGRHLLRDHELNPALWPLVLERAKKVSTLSLGTCSHSDLVFHLVHGPALSM